MSISKNDLRKSLHRFMDVILEEAEHNPPFADKLLDVLSLAEAPPEHAARKRKGNVELPADPFEVFHSEGAIGLKAWLDHLDLEQLRTIVRIHKLDSTRNSDKWKTKERFIDLIMDRLPERTKQGDAFRAYGQPSSAAASAGEFRPSSTDLTKAQ